MPEPIITPDPVVEPVSRAEERITQLSTNLKTTATERDTEKARAEAAEKERDFYAGFSDIVATNPAAKEHKDDILSKVKSGYTVEDATFAVLGKAGKLGAQAPVSQSPAGGSATNAITGTAEKSVGEMSRQEMRDKLAQEIVWQ